MHARLCLAMTCNYSIATSSETSSYHQIRLSPSVDALFLQLCKIQNTSYIPVSCTLMAAALGLFILHAPCNNNLCLPRKIAFVLMNRLRVAPASQQLRESSGFHLVCLFLYPSHIEIAHSLRSAALR